MKVDDMIGFIHYTSSWPGFTIADAEAVLKIEAKLRAAEELANVIQDIYARVSGPDIETLLGPSLELRLGNRLHDYRVAGTEEAKK